LSALAQSPSSSCTQNVRTGQTSLLLSEDVLYGQTPIVINQLKVQNYQKSAEFDLARRAVDVNSE